MCFRALAIVRLKCTLWHQWILTEVGPREHASTPPTGWRSNLYSRKARGSVSTWPTSGTIESHGRGDQGGLREPGEIGRG
jgi:hypothetical protein